MSVHRLYAALLALNLAGFLAIAGLANSFGTLATPYSISMRSVIFSLSALLILLAVLRKNTAFTRDFFWVLFLFFWASYVFRLFYDTSLGGNNLSKDANDYWIWALGACLIPSLALLVKVKIEAFRAAYSWSIVLVFIASIFGLFSGNTDHLSSEGFVYDSGRLRTESINPISLGHIGLSLIFLSIWPNLIRIKNISFKRKLVLISGVILGLLLVVSSSSRGPIVTLLSVMLFYLFSINIKKMWKPILISIVILAAGYMLSIKFEESGQFNMASRIGSALSGDDGTFNIRKVAYAGAWRQFLGSPLFGDGLEEKITGFYPHNVVLESFMATGVVGGVSFLSMLILGLVYAYKLLKWRVVSGWVALIFMQYVIASQFSGAIYNVTTMWTFLAATVSCYSEARRRFELPVISTFKKN